MSSNLSRRAFLSSVGIAVAAPSVVANAVKEACVVNPSDVLISWVIDWETIKIDIPMDSNFGRGYSIVFTSDSDKVQYIPIHD